MTTEKSIGIDRLWNRPSFNENLKENYDLGLEKS